MRDVETALAFRERVPVLNRGRRLKFISRYVLAWPCPFCGAVEHRHNQRGIQTSACGKGIYRVLWNRSTIL